MRERFIHYNRAAVWIVMVLFIAQLALGQGIVTGSISGTVVDPQGALVSGANVQATQKETNRVFTTTSSNGGVIQLPSLPPGTYRVTVSAQGFSQYSAGTVIVAVGVLVAGGSREEHVAPESIRLADCDGAGESPARAVAGRPALPRAA